MADDLINYTCTICNSDSFDSISSEGMHSFPTMVSVCNQCGLVQLNPRWSETTYRKFYKVEFDKHYREISFNEKKIKTIYFRMKKYGFCLDSPKNILDIGAGSGESLLYLRKHIYPLSRYYAIEPSDQCSNDLQKNNIELISKSIEDDWEENYDKFFDFIILRHVLEHTFDPVLVLGKIAKVLKDDGILYLAVPNALKPTYPIRNNHFRNVHIYYFNKFSLDNLFRLCGLKNEKMVEGDSFLSSEIYCFLQPAISNESINLDTRAVLRQKNIYLKRLKLEKYRLFIWVKRIDKIINSIISRVRFFSLRIS